LAEDNTTFNDIKFNHEFFIYNIPDGIINTTNDTKFKIYPVPARDKIVIVSHNSINSIKAIEIINLVGQKVLVKNRASLFGDKNFTINVSGLKQGIYLLNIIGDNLFVTQKIVIY
jgi:hypothetical protein